MAPTVWDHDAHLALLQAIIEHANPSAQLWEKIVDTVATKGYYYTPSAALYGTFLSIHSKSPC